LPLQAGPVVFLVPDWMVRGQSFAQVVDHSPRGGTPGSASSGDGRAPGQKTRRRL
jgi:hypothetical protein